MFRRRSRLELTNFLHRLVVLAEFLHQLLDWRVWRGGTEGLPFSRYGVLRGQPGDICVWVLS